MTGISVCQARYDEGPLAGPFENGGSTGVELADRTNVRRLGTLLPLGRLELDARALGEGLEAITRDAAEVHEEVLRPILRRDEAVALLVAEPLHSACSHL